MSKLPAWRFRKMQEGEINIDPYEGEFFTTEALGSLNDVLVREAVQNSLDAKLPDSKAHLRIFLSHGPESLESSDRDHYLKELFPHLRARGSGLASPPADVEPFDYLVLEDFGTRGLRGDPRQIEDVEGEGGEKNDFYYFWRNIGRSMKHSTDLGRWGLGKTVFQAASRINAFFGLTVLPPGPAPLLMGQAVLKIHKTGGERYSPYGYFAHFDGDLSLPVAGDDTIRRFCSDFHLQRTSESGLSVVIPYPEPEITARGILRSVLHHYFMPILGGELSVEVAHGKERHLLDACTIEGAASGLGPAESAGILPLIRLARWGLGVDPGQHVPLHKPDKKSAPSWRDNPIDPILLKVARESFDQREKMAFMVPIWVKKRDAKAELAHFQVFLERDDRLQRGEDHFVRDGLTITGVRSLRQKGVRTIVSVKDPCLSALLGDSENPSHTEWQERSKKLKENYEHGPFTLRYVRSAPREIIKALTLPKEARDENLLAGIFSLSRVVEQEKERSRPETPKTPSADGDKVAAGNPMAGSSQAFLLNKLKDGFRLVPGHSQEPLPERFRLTIAYEIRKGDPFRRYHPLDFDLGQNSIAFRGEEVRVLAKRENAAVFALMGKHPMVEFRGFDPHRDLRVRWEPLQGGVE